MMFSTMVKVSVSFILLGWLISQIDWEATWQIFQTFNLVYLIPVVLLSLSGILLSVYKWSQILKSMHHHPPLFGLLRIFWIGMFFNNFLPGRAGGDIVRWYGLSQMLNTNLHAPLSIVLDRGLNLAALVFIGLLFFLPNAQSWSIQAPENYIIAGGILVLICGSISLSSRLKSWIQKQVTEIYKILKTIKTSQMIGIFAVAIIYQTTMISSHVFIAKGLGQHLATSHFFYLIPITALTTLLPISINGIGVRESTFVFAFTQVGMTPENAIALSIFATLTTMVLSLIGGLLYTLNPIAPHKPCI